MLKNLSPIVTGALLRSLDAAPRGAWIAVIGRGQGPAGIPTPGSFESVVQAVLSVTPLETAPILVQSGMEFTDEGYTVLGLASDAEGRSIDLLPIDDAAFGAMLRTSVVRIVVDSPQPVGVLMCKGEC